MTISTNAAGVACCGNCGSELEIRCTGGCPEPDVVFRENFAATMAKLGGHPGKRGPFRKYGPQKKTPIRRPGFCAWVAGCDLPVAKREPGHGRTPIMCENHLNLSPSRAKVPA